jgi:hypothetical protein
MTENDKNSLLGKKIFFLHPSVLVQNQIVSELAQEEFEVYVIKDENKIRQALKKYPDSILFASINEAMKESAWVELIQGIQKKPETSAVNIGVIASSNDENTKRKYSELLTLNCGYTVIKADVNNATKQIATILNSVDAKGRRKYIRMIIEKEINTTVNLPVNGTFINGAIKDISVVGFSCSFPEDPGLKKNSLFGDMQIRLQSQLLKAEGIVFGSRVDGSEEVYVILFSQRIDPSVRSKVRKYIQTHLQSRMDEELK